MDVYIGLIQAQRSIVAQSSYDIRHVLLHATLVARRREPCKTGTINSIRCTQYLKCMAHVMLLEL